MNNPEKSINPVSRPTQHDPCQQYILGYEGKYVRINMLLWPRFLTYLPSIVICNQRFRCNIEEPCPALPTLPGPAFLLTINRKEIVAHSQSKL